MNHTVNLGGITYLSSTRIEISFERYDRTRQSLTTEQMVDNGLDPGKINPLF